MTPPELVEKVGSFRTVTHGGHQFPTSLVTHYFPLDALIVSQLGRFVKGVFYIFFREEALDYCSALAYGIPTLRWLYRVSPLDTIIIT